MMTKTQLQVSTLEGYAEGRDKPGGETGVDSGASRQGRGGHQWLAGALGTRLTCRAVGTKAAQQPPFPDNAEARCLLKGL